VWLHDGARAPELKVRDAQTRRGGYVMLLVLEGGEIRLLGTRFPAKHAANWRSNAVRQRDGPLASAVVLGLHPRYEKIKRLLATSLAGDEEKGSQGRGGGRRTHSVDSVFRKAEVLFNSPATNAHRVEASQEAGPQQA
jgi:hypothetical protein